MSPKSTEDSKLKDEGSALIRFITSIIALVIITLSDLIIATSEVPTVVYLLLGGLNGMDAYKLYKEVNK